MGLPSPDDGRQVVEITDEGFSCPHCTFESSTLDPWGYVEDGSAGAAVVKRECPNCERHIYL